MAPLNLDNPFLDPFSAPQGGILTSSGQPLNRILFPSIFTLIPKTSEKIGELSTVNINNSLLKTGITPQEYVLVRDDIIGIELNLNLFGSATISDDKLLSQTTPSDPQIGQTIGKFIPKNYREARRVLHLITSQRTGSRNVAFNINELKKIARNLELVATGNKDVLANRIRTAIIEFFDLPYQ